MKGKRDLYSVPPRELPRYSIPEAAQYLCMSPSTLRSWVAGRKYPVASGVQFWEPLIQRPKESDPRLSFSNLLEAYTLQALRTEYHVDMTDIRTAIEYTKKRHGVDRFLLCKELRVIPGNVFLDELDRLINVGKAGQEAMRGVLAAYLKRIKWKGKFPKQLFPVTRTWQADGPQVVTILPEIAFGRPVVCRKWIRTGTIAERFKAGESVLDLADDYELEVLEIEEAIRYEQPTALAA